MNKYELTIVLPGKATSAKKTSTAKAIEKIVTTLGGKTDKLSDWGVVELAYKIEKNTSGLFLHIPLEMEPKNAFSLDQKLKMEENIIRYLLVRV